MRRQPAGAQRGTARRARAEQSRCVGLEVLPPAPVCPGRGPGVREVLSSYRPVVLPGGSGLTGAPPFGSGSSHPLPALGGPVKRCTGHEGPCPTDGPWPLLLWVWWAPLAPVCVLAPFIPRLRAASAGGPSPDVGPWTLDSESCTKSVCSREVSQAQDWATAVPHGP